MPLSQVIQTAPKKDYGPYRFYWNGMDITEEIMNNRTPGFVNLRFAEIEVKPTKRINQEK